MICTKYLIQKQLKSDKALFFTILNRHFFLIFSNFVLNFWYNYINIPKIPQSWVTDASRTQYMTGGRNPRKNCVLWLMF